MRRGTCGVNVQVSRVRRGNPAQAFYLPEENGICSQRPVDNFVDGCGAHSRDWGL
jgi:hypothetical protein